MTSSGKLSSAIVDFVAPLRLWHGLRPPPMVGFVERESGGPASRSALRAFERAGVQERQRVARGRERARERASSFQLSGLDIPKGGWSNQSVGTGRSPACTAGLLQGIFNGEKNNF